MFWNSMPMSWRVLGKNIWKIPWIHTQHLTFVLNKKYLKNLCLWLEESLKKECKIIQNSRLEKYLHIFIRIHIYGWKGPPKIKLHKNPHPWKSCSKRDIEKLLENPLYVAWKILEINPKKIKKNSLTVPWGVFHRIL